MVKWFLSNWYVIIVCCAVLVGVVYKIYKFVKLPSDAQIESLREWLKYAVAMAEIELGSGTGQLKLRMVYDWFVDTFPYLAKVVLFDTFSVYVDEALAWLNNQLSTNEAIETLITGDNEGIMDSTENNVTE